MNKVQVLICKCGATYAACIEPNCYEDVDWLKEISKCIGEGGTVEMRQTQEFKFKKCTCK